MKTIEFILILFWGASSGFMITMLIIAVFHLDCLDFYKKGQIDAINGKIKYELKEDENMEVKWVKKFKTK